MSQDDELGVMPGHAAVRAARTRLTFPPTQDGQAIVWDADLKLILAALSARDEAQEALQALERLAGWTDGDINLSYSGPVSSRWLVDFTGSDRQKGEAHTLLAAIQALAAQLPGVAGKQESKGAAGEGEMEEAREG